MKTLTVKIKDLKKVKIKKPITPWFTGVFLPFPLVIIYLFNLRKPRLIELTLSVILPGSLWDKFHHIQSIQSIIHQVQSSPTGPRKHQDTLTVE